MDRETHARFLEYRARHGYFARGESPMMTAAEFMPVDAEWCTLEAMAEADRSDEDEARLDELRAILFLD